MTGDFSAWRPSASLDTLRIRAKWLARIRSFFAARGVLEVETPLLSAAGSTDPNLASIRAATALGPRWLHTSPEFPMKRLLAAGSGPIYQVCKAFRDGEQGRWHNPEFTMLEWYRPGFSLDALIAEVLELVGDLSPEITTSQSPERLSYRAAFQRECGLDPFTVEESQLREACLRHGVPLPGSLESGDRDGWLDLLMGAVIGPRLGHGRLCVVEEYPVSQAALARLKPGSMPPVAERFELYWQGVELANGFHELAQAEEQRRRFAIDQRNRAARHLPSVPQDENLLLALQQGLPDCCGVALGLDRLLAVALGHDRLVPVLAFPFDRA